jgi:hypothetical protein
MILHLVGVCEDGGTRGANVPVNPRHEISITCGESVVLKLQALRANGEPFDTAGWGFVWGFKKKRNGVQMRREGSPVLADGPGRVDFVLSAAETAALKPGQYAYDIFAFVPIDGGAQEVLVPYSDLHVEPSLYPSLTAAVTPSPGLPLNPATNARVYGAVPSGAINGVNAAFLIAEKVVLGKETVFVNGVRQARGASADYLLQEGSGFGTGYDTVTMAYALRVGDVIAVDYDPA